MSGYIEIVQHDPVFARMAAISKFSAGNNWIAGKDFLLKMSCWADSYTHNTVWVLLPESGDIFHHENLRIRKNEHWKTVLYTKETFNEFLKHLSLQWADMIIDRIWPAERKVKHGH